MFFVLSKLVAVLVFPFTWFVACFISALLLKNPQWKRRLMVSALVILFLFGNKLLFGTISKSVQPPPVSFRPSDRFSCGILMGGMAGYDNNGTGYFNANADRFIAAVELYHQKHIQYILITGGSSSVLRANYNEAAFVSAHLAKAGVLKQHILIEPKARNTFENGIYAKQMLDSLRLAPPYVLITSASHINRSMKVFHKAGLTNTVAYPCNYIVMDKHGLFDYFLPQTEVFYAWQKVLKEWIGTLAYRLTGKA